MTVTATIIKDSIGSDAPRLTTFELRYPRFIHAEAVLGGLAWCLVTIAKWIQGQNTNFW